MTDIQQKRQKIENSAQVTAQEGMTYLQRKRQIIGNFILMWINNQWTSGVINSKQQYDRLTRSLCPFLILPKQQLATQVVPDINNFGSYSGCLTKLFNSIEDMCLWINKGGWELVSSDQITSTASELCMEVRSDAVISFIVTFFQRKATMIDTIKGTYVFALGTLFERNVFALSTLFRRRNLGEVSTLFRRRFVQGESTLDVLKISPIIISLGILYGQNMKGIMEPSLIRLERELTQFHKVEFVKEFKSVRYDEKRVMLIVEGIKNLYREDRSKKIALNLVTCLFFGIGEIRDFDGLLMDGLVREDTVYYTLLAVQEIAKHVEKGQAKNRRILGVLCPRVLIIARELKCPIARDILYSIKDSCSDICKKKDLAEVRQFLGWKCH